MGNETCKSGLSMKLKIHDAFIHIKKLFSNIRAALTASRAVIASEKARWVYDRT